MRYTRYLPNLNVLTQYKLTELGYQTIAERSEWWLKTGETSQYCQPSTMRLSQGEASQLIERLEHEGFMLARD